MAIDPICGMQVNEKGASFYTHYHHETIYFCSKICKQSYDMDRKLDHRSWWQRLLDRMVEANRKLYGEVSPQTFHGGSRHTLPQYRVNLGKAGLVIDPVCRMEIHKGTAAATRGYKGKTYCFCAVECGNRFDENPEIYTGGMKEPHEGEDVNQDE